MIISPDFLIFTSKYVAFYELNCSFTKETEQVYEWKDIESKTGV